MTAVTSPVFVLSQKISWLKCVDAGGAACALAWLAAGLLRFAANGAFSGAAGGADVTGRTNWQSARHVVAGALAKTAIDRAAVGLALGLGGHQNGNEYRGRYSGVCGASARPLNGARKPLGAPIKQCSLENRRNCG